MKCCNCFIPSTTKENIMVKKSKGFGDYGKKRRMAKKLGAENVFWRL